MVNSTNSYTNKVLNQISPSFCAAKWFNATIWLDSGHTTSCHHPPKHKINQASLQNNPSALHNTDQKVRERKLMLKGARPPGCDYCWKLEDLGTDKVISDRVFKSQIYSDQEVLNLKSLDPTQAPLKTLEISFGNSCNFSCSYCNVGFSSAWETELRKQGPYQNLIHTDGRPYTNKIRKKSSLPNIYSDSFWKWWPELSSSLQELRITGGEPLLSKEFWKVIDIYHLNKDLKLPLSVNTNLGVSSQLIQKLLISAQFIDDLTIYTSCESVGEQAEFIRKGMNYKVFLNNCEQVLDSQNIRSLNIMLTINSLSLFGLTNFLDQCLKWKNKYGEQRLVLTFNILRFPNFMSCLVLPKTLRSEIAEQLASWLKQHDHSSLILIHERTSMIRLIAYLRKTHPLKKYRSRAIQKDFKSFFHQYSHRYGKQITDIFPSNFSIWYNSLPEPTHSDYLYRVHDTFKTLLHSLKNYRSKFV